ncbi:MAG: hypothetical protein WDZ52_01545 [Pseudohongiellaceae bacterium]
MLQTGIAGLGGQLLGHSALSYERHQPEQTLLYPIVDKHYPDFLAQLATEPWSIPLSNQANPLPRDCPVPGSPTAFSHFSWVQKIFHDKGVDEN